MPISRRVFTLTIAPAALLLGLVGCDEDDGPAEQLGEKIDDAVEKAGDKVDEAAQELERKTD